MSNLQERMALAKQNYERVRGLRFKNVDLADYCRVSKASVGQWFNGPTKQLEGTNLTLAAEFFGVNHKWLAGENVPMSNSVGETKDGFNNVQVIDLRFKKIPVLDFVQAGQWREVIYDGVVPLTYTYTDYESSDPSTVFGVIVDGLSMAPDFKPGDRLVVDAAKIPSPGSLVIAQNGSHEVTFKKYRVTGYDEEGREEFELIPINPDFPVISSKMANISVIGVVVRHTREFK